MIALERPASARFFFNFISDVEVISDETGVDLSTEGDVIGHIARALEDLYRDSSFATAEWDGWKIVVTDWAGQPVLSMTLGDSSREGDGLCSVTGDFKSHTPIGMHHVRCTHLAS